MMTQTVLRVRPNGPNMVTGDFVVVGARTATGAKASASLCRCGKSRTKPFCDDSHEKTRFKG